MHWIRMLFDRLRDAHLTINLAKCEFAKAMVTYLGKVVGQGQVQPVQSKVAGGEGASKKELRCFLGLVGYYRGFCRDFATMVALLTDLMKTKAAFVWSTPSAGI